MFGNERQFPAYSHSAFGVKSPLSQPRYLPEEKYKNMKKDYYRFNLISNRVSSFANEKSTERSTDKDPIFSSRRQSSFAYPSAFDIVSSARNNQNKHDF